MHDLLRLVHHLGLSYPQRRFRNRYRKIVYLNTVKLTYGNLDYFAQVKLYLTVLLPHFNGFVFKTPQGYIRFRKKISAAAGWVKKFQRGQLVLKLQKLGILCFRLLVCLDFIKFFF